MMEIMKIQGTNPFGFKMGFSWNEDKSDKISFGVITEGRMDEPQFNKVGEFSMEDLSNAVSRKDPNDFTVTDDYDDSEVFYKGIYVSDLDNAREFLNEVNSKLEDRKKKIKEEISRLKEELKKL